MGEPFRKCVGCSGIFPKKELLRIVRTEEGIFLDPGGKRDGRGAYICRNNECLRIAVKRKGLDRAFRSRVPEEVYLRIGKEIFSENE